MAQIGLRYPVAAPIVQYQENGLPIYGTGFYIGRMVKADKTYDKNDASLYADDGRVEYDAGICCEFEFGSGRTWNTQECIRGNSNQSGSNSAGGGISKNKCFFWKQPNGN